MQCFVQRCSRKGHALGGGTLEETFNKKSVGGVSADVDRSSIEEKLEVERKNRVKWGFVWALVCALTWGLGYVPLQMAWSVEPFINFQFVEGMGGYVVSAIMISAGQAIIFGLVLMVIWAGATGKLRDVGRIVRNHRISRWLLVGSLFGGPVAIFGSTLAIGYIGAGFAASIGLLSAVVGALVGWLYNKEKMTKKTVFGILAILVGGVIILDPQAMIDNITNPASADGVWLGYLGGIMSALGWGLEGNFSVRALDVTDSDASLPVRYITESSIWLIIIFPITLVAIGPGVFADVFIASFTSGAFIFWMVLGALTLGICYVCQYKSFPLLGVGRTLALGSLYVPVSLIGLFVFLGIAPTWTLALGAVIAVAGMFIMYWESGDLKTSNRTRGGE